MKRFVICVLSLLVFFGGGLVQARENAGLIKTVSGDVGVLRGGQSITAQSGMAMIPEDTVITGEKSYAGIIFSDGTRFTMGPGSRFELTRYRFEPENLAYDFSMYLEKGSAVYQSGKIGKLAPEAVTLSTPRATVGVRGTRFIIKIEE